MREPNIQEALEQFNVTVSEFIANAKDAIVEARTSAQADEAETIAKYIETTTDEMENVRAALTPSLPTVKPLLLSFAADIRAGKHRGSTGS